MKAVYRSLFIPNDYCLRPVFPVPAVRFIAEQATKGIGVREVAATVPLSRRTLERRFHQATGRTILDEIRAVQVERAKLLLADETVTLKRVALVSGFASTKALGKVFLRVTGMIPSAYRAAHSRGKGN